jgi:hypothetical protein
MVSNYRRYQKLLGISHGELLCPGFECRQSFFVFYFKSDFVPYFRVIFCDFQDDFFKFYSDESDGLSLEDTDDASESETYHNRLAMSIDQCR